MSKYNRAVMLGQYIAHTGATVRTTAQVFGISKSTVHKDVTQYLSQDGELYEKVQQVLARNKAERHLRGGAATKQMYLIKRQNGRQQ